MRWTLVWIAYTVLAVAVWNLRSEVRQASTHAEEARTLLLMSTATLGEAMTKEMVEVRGQRERFEQTLLDSFVLQPKIPEYPRGRKTLRWPWSRMTR